MIDWIEDEECLARWLNKNVIERNYSLNEMSNLTAKTLMAMTSYLLHQLSKAHFTQDAEGFALFDETKEVDKATDQKIRVATVWMKKLAHEYRRLSLEDEKARGDKRKCLKKKKEKRKIQMSANIAG